jgi:hypothetical protein
MQSLGGWYSLKPWRVFTQGLTKTLIGVWYQFAFLGCAVTDMNVDGGVGGGDGVVAVKLKIGW